MGTHDYRLNFDMTSWMLFYANNLFNPDSAALPPQRHKAVFIHPTLAIRARHRHSTRRVSMLGGSQHHDVTITGGTFTEVQGDVNHYHIKGNYHNHNTEVGE